MYHKNQKLTYKYKCNYKYDTNDELNNWNLYTKQYVDRQT